MRSKHFTNRQVKRKVLHRIRHFLSRQELAGVLHRFAYHRRQWWRRNDRIFGAVRKGDIRGHAGGQIQTAFGRISHRQCVRMLAGNRNHPTKKIACLVRGIRKPGTTRQKDPDLQSATHDSSFPDTALRMLRAAITNMVFILAAAILLLLAHSGFVPRIAFGLLLAVYLLVLFCGAYFIRLNFFVRSVLRGESWAKQIALSFDDGPDGENTLELLDILDRHAVQATFFCIGKNIAGQEPVLQRMVNAGHTIGNHSGTHGFFSIRCRQKKCWPTCG